MIKTSVCCVLSVRRLHEMVVLSVKIVVPEDMVIAAKNVKLDSIAHPHQTMPRRVRYAVLGGINLTLDKQAAYHAHLESTNTLKEKKHVQIVRLDDRQTLLGIMQQCVMHVR